MSDSKKLDVIVIGLGAMGSAALYHLSKPGLNNHSLNILGIDKYAPPHELGSSHGESRIIRRANGEGEFYHPLITRAFELWHELEEASGEVLFMESGGFVIESETTKAGFHGHSSFVNASSEIATKYGIDFEVIDSAEIKKRLPMIKARPDERAYVEPSGGIMRPERCIASHLDQAQKHGAVVQVNEQMIDYTYTADGVTVTTDKGTYQADKLILATGVDMQKHMPEEIQPLVDIYQQKIFWFEVDDLEQFKADKFPFVIWIKETRDDYFCAFPVPVNGSLAVKIMSEQYLETCDPATIDRHISEEEIAEFYDHYVVPNVSGVNSTCLRSSICHYTVTKDEHFIIDFHPETDRVVLASPCSGHGFKFSAAIGESLAQLATQGKSVVNIDNFSLKRFDS